MQNELRDICKEIILLSKEVDKYYNNRLKISNYGIKISGLLEEIEKKNNRILGIISPESTGNIKISSKDIMIDKDYLKEVISRIKGGEKSVDVQKYSIYKTNFYIKISNHLFGELSLKLARRFPSFFDGLFSSLKSSDIKVLSKSYVSSMLLSSLLAFIVSLAALILFMDASMLVKIPSSLLLAILFSIIVFASIYYYPYLSLSMKKQNIKDDLPFVVIHMSAIAASGAQPLAMFNMVVDSTEYKGLESEIKKIVNYVNLMGYDLSTAMKNVALTTPSKPFKELLNGIATTIESGGSLKDYLDAKAEDLMETYRLDRKKFVETISTYSDIYIGVLLAAPLLFFVTLAIIQLLGGAIFGLSVKTIAIAGTYFVIPILNGMFLMFLNIVQYKG